MSDRSLDDLHPALKPLCERWLAACKTQSIDAFVTQTYRSTQQQDADYARGRTTPGRVITNARGGQSKHNFTVDGKPASLAFDFAIERPDGSLNWDVSTPEWKSAVAMGKELGLAWGGDWKGIKDGDHFELDQPATQENLPWPNTTSK